MKQPLLKSDRIRLRALEPEDLEALYQWENDSTLWEFGSTLQPFSSYQLREYLASSNRNILESGQLRLMIERLEDQKSVGTVDLYEVDAFHGRAGVGILIDSAFQHSGFATEALALLRKYAFDFLGLNQLFAYIPSDNQASIRLFTQCQFEQTGLLKRWNKVMGKNYRDVLVFQCLKPF